MAMVAEMWMKMEEGELDTNEMNLEEDEL